MKRSQDATIIMIFLTSNKREDRKIAQLRKEMEEHFTITWQEKSLGNRKIIFLFLSITLQWEIEKRCKPVLGLPQNRISPENLTQIWDLIGILESEMQELLEELEGNKAPDVCKVMCTNVLERRILDRFVRKMPTCVAT